MDVEQIEGGTKVFAIEGDRAEPKYIDHLEDVHVYQSIQILLDSIIVLMS